MTTLVTGVSHDQGIGAAVCRLLAERGENIIFTTWGTDIDWAAEFKLHLENLGIEIYYIEADFSNPGAPDELVDQLNELPLFPTALVNNAAYSANDSYERLNGESLDEHYYVNMRTPFLLTTKIAQRWIDFGITGKIVNLTSGQDLGPMVNEIAYVSTKAAVRAFTESLAAELAPYDINVNAVNPGPTNTGWMDPAMEKELSKKFSKGRIGQPEDAAKAIAFLLSDEADWIVGQVIHSEGGFLRS